jgi:uncharacterized protein
MELEAEILVPGSRQQVWNRLIDPAVLQRCIPGCSELDRTTETDFAGKMVVKVGPVSATFQGGVSLEEMAEPERCVLAGQGKGGAAGFAKGSATITLLEEGDSTRLAYVATVQIGGKLAAVGNKLFGSVARRNIDEFFDAFQQVMREDQPVAG